MTKVESVLTPLFDGISDGICASDAGGNILYMNPAAERMLEVQLPQARGRTLCEILCGHLATPGSKECASQCPLRDPDSAEKSVTFKGRHNQRLSYELGEQGLKRVEKWRNLRVRCLRMPAGSDSHFTVIEDVSAEMELERRREDWRNMIAHDLRTPLTTIFAALRELQENAARQNVAGPELKLLEMGVRNCRKMTELLGLYLDLAKLDAGLMPVRISRLSLAEMVRGCVGEQEALAKEKSIQVDVDIPADLVVLADADLVPRVIQNILNNALKFSPERGRVSLKAEREPHEAVLLAIQDKGPGINPEDLPYIFDRYHQAKARRRGRIQGTGLGLTFCREALKAMQGSISVESAPGKGSLFTIRLPSAPEMRDGGDPRGGAL